MPRPKPRQPEVQQAIARQKARFYPGLRKYARDGYSYRHQMMAAFLYGKGDAKFYGLRNMMWLTYPQFTSDIICDGPEPNFILTNAWNPWLVRLFKAFTNESHAVRQGDSVFRFVGLSGAGACGKTFTTALYAVLWWMVDPDNSIVILTSTTKDMIRNRMWAIVRNYLMTAVDMETGEPLTLCHLIDSQMKAMPPDTKDPARAIAAYAVAHGETMKAIDNIKGMHAPRMLVAIDEANGTPEAIYEVLPNYRKGCLDLTVLILGNPGGRLDAHGRAMKPAEGWALTMDESVTEWKTEGVPDWQLDPGIGIRMDGRDSPNVRLKQNLYPYLFTYDNWLQAQDSKHHGTPNYWRQTRGMWPPEGMDNVIFTEQLFLRCESIGTHFTFESEREAMFAVDPGFGGDACMCYFGYLGDVAGRKCLQLVEHFELPIDPTMLSTDIDYQIARRVQQECIVRQVKPYCCAIDSTGVGRGVASILAAEWSQQIQCVNFGQAATERASSQNDGRPSREVYSNFVTELWYSVREAMEAGQVKGFSNDCVTQLCSRQYEMKGRKIQAEPKSDMRLRLRFSPDIGDACALILEVARRNGLEISGKLTQNANRDWKAVQRQAEADAPVENVHGDTGGWAEMEDGVHDVQIVAEEW